MAGGLVLVARVVQEILHAVDKAETPHLLLAHSHWPRSLQRPPEPLVWPSEKHPVFEMAFVSKESCAMVIEGAGYSMLAGDLCLIPPGQVHYETPLGPGQEYEISWLQFRENSVGIFSHQVVWQKEARMRRIAMAEVAHPPGAEDLLNALLYEAASPGLFSATVLRGYLLALLGRLCRSLHGGGGGLSVSHPLQPAEEDPVVTAVRELIHSEYANSELSLSVLAQHVALSPNYLISHFKSKTGCSPYQYLLQMRLRKAQELLATEELPVHRVASAVGFTSPYHFSMTFKKHCGMSPSEFRRVSTGGGGH